MINKIFGVQILKRMELFTFLNLYLFGLYHYLHWIEVYHSHQELLRNLLRIASGRGSFL